MAEFLTVLLLSFVMFFGCILAGWIPLAFTLSARKIQLFSLFGAGLLVGTALAVIIPEGVDTMYDQRSLHVSDIDQSEEIKDADEFELAMLSTEVKNLQLEFKDTGTPKTHTEGPHKAIGLALLLGFVFMLLVDQIGGTNHSHAPDNIRLDELNQSKVGTSRSQADQRSKSHTATIGLVVHAAADGIALGAAASTERQDLQIIVFLAIMLHKAPAAFGLVSFLVHEGLEARKVKRHLLMFALAAPILTIITYSFLNQDDKQALTDVNATGVAMLFSAGTFLYVATVHVLPELSHASNGNKRLSLCEVAVLVAGSLLPLFLNISHSHG